MKPAYNTPWTKKGHRLHVDATATIFIVTCETKLMHFQQEEVTSYMMSKVALPNTTLASIGERFLKHAVSFYEDDELTDAVVAEFRAMLDGLKERQGEPPPPTSSKMGSGAN